MDAEMGRQLNAAILDSHFKLSVRAKQLLELTVDAMESDPLPYGIEPLSRRDCQMRAIRNLTKFIDFVGKSRNKEKIGVFELLEAAPQLIGAQLIFKGPD
jgi:hypothetical protein